MGTRGYRAYRYKNKYYRLYNHWDSYPTGRGVWFANLIPRDAAQREAWVQHVIQGLEAGEAWRHENGIDDYTEHETKPSNKDDPFHDGEPVFSQIIHHNYWITGDLWIEWTYVFDLDCRAFTVNGLVHFNLDNMPQNPGFEDYFDDDRTLKSLLPIPEQYLTAVSYWPALDCDVDVILNEYTSLQPRILSLEDWGAPTWNSLSNAQHFSAKLVKTIVSDYKQILAVPDLAEKQPKIILICWQVACAAATSHVLCPAQSTSLPDITLYMTVAHGHLDYEDEDTKRVVRHRMNAGSYARVYCWFRGCLIRFSLRLDEDTLLRHEVNGMVKRLRKNGRSGGIGVAMSSNQLVAVSVDQSQVRQSPLLDFHDAKGNVGDGLLLLLHLLSPATTVNKTPWASVPTAPHCSPSSIMPGEVIRHVLRFTDFDTYHFILPLVSRLIRSICLARPRFGNLVLVATNPDESYQVLPSNGPTAEMHVKLVRTQTLDPTLLGTFQHHKAATCNAEVGAKTIVEKPDQYSRPQDPLEVLWYKMVRCNGQPPMRVQVVEGVWNMVEVDGVDGEVGDRA
ncbi:hypothetical protein FRC06_006902 [Ceratobasidium sp. 370]|nr:hypothetical protein FRC06_006902 [Ceratobasidium sp. 370]